MIKRACGTFALIGNYDRRYGTLTGNTFSTDRQLQHVYTANIGDETGRR